MLSNGDTADGCWTHRVLRQIGLGRPDLRAWALYDFANSAFVTTVVAAVFPVYFGSVAAADLPPAVATARFAVATTIAMAVIGVLAPVLGALADESAAKKRLLGVFLVIGVVATAAMGTIGRGDWLFAAAAFAIANIGAWGTFVFYDSLLPHIVRDDKEMDRVSAAGYALGYVGGGLLLAVNLAWIAHPTAFGLADSATAARLSFVSVAIWWGVFSIPLFRRVAEPAGNHRPSHDGPRIIGAFHRLGETIDALRQYRQAIIFLAAFLLFNDGIGTIIRMAAIFGTEIGLPQNSLLGAILLVQVVGVPCAIAFGWLAGVTGIKPALLSTLAIYILVSFLAFSLTTAWQFYLMAVLVGMVQGGSQALSRSLFARLVPRNRSAEFFAFFAVCEKAAGVLGPGVFAGVVALTGSSRQAVLSLVVFFLAGGGLVCAVDVAAGQRIAERAAERPPKDSTGVETGSVA